MTDIKAPASLSHLFVRHAANAGRLRVRRVLTFINAALRQLLSIDPHHIQARGHTVRMGVHVTTDRSPVHELAVISAIENHRLSARALKDAAPSTTRRLEHHVREREAFATLLDQKPESVSELLALLCYLGEAFRNDEDLLVDRDDVARLVLSLGEASCSLSGKQACSSR